MIIICVILITRLLLARGGTDCVDGAVLVVPVAAISVVAVGLIRRTVAAACLPQETPNWSKDRRRHVGAVFLVAGIIRVDWFSSGDDTHGWKDGTITRRLARLRLLQAVACSCISSQPPQRTVDDPFALKGFQARKDGDPTETEKSERRIGTAMHVVFLGPWQERESDLA
jgi:hypothetical protein